MTPISTISPKLGLRNEAKRQEHHGGHACRRSEGDRTISDDAVLRARPAPSLARAVSRPVDASSRGAGLRSWRWARSMPSPLMPFLNSVMPTPSDRMTEGSRLPNSSSTTMPTISISIGPACRTQAQYDIGKTDHRSLGKMGGRRRGREGRMNPCDTAAKRPPTRINSTGPGGASQTAGTARRTPTHAIRREMQHNSPSQRLQRHACEM